MKGKIGEWWKKICLEIFRSMLHGFFAFFSGVIAGADLGGGCRGCAPSPEMTCGFLIQLVFC